MVQDKKKAAEIWNAGGVLTTSFPPKKGRFFKPELVHCGVGQQRQLLVELPV